MALEESDREDLMREATALHRRMELAIPDALDHVILGERDNLTLSIYCGPDPVYHFDESNRLRRAYVRGSLYRTQGTTLAKLNRTRTPRQTMLVRQDLSSSELQEFFEDMQQQLSGLVRALDSGLCQVVQQVPVQPGLLAEFHQRLRTALSNDFTLAPQIKGKK